jgi:hypothetical protein
MDPNSVLNALRESNVVTVDGATGDVHTSSEFDDAVDDRSTVLGEADRDELSAEIKSHVPHESAVELIRRIGPADIDYVPEYVEITERVPALPLETRILVLITVAAMRSDDVRMEGTPAAFTPIDGDLLDCLDAFSHSILYVWRDECPTCDIVKEKLDEILAEPPSDVALFALYGPAHAETVHRQFDVVGGPTTLFLREGCVHTRLVGDKATSGIENEIELFVGRSMT